MKNLSQNIAKYILSRLDDEPENFVSLRRKELAEMFECVPSQINYVLRSRFRPEHGYIIDSRRGEHGYIKIVKIICITPEEKYAHVEAVIGNTITCKQAHRLLENLEKRGYITQRERLLMEISLRELNLVLEGFTLINRGESLADLLKNMLSGIMLSNDDANDD